MGSRHKKDQHQKGRKTSRVLVAARGLVGLSSSVMEGHRSDYSFGFHDHSEKLLVSYTFEFGTEPFFSPLQEEKSKKPPSGKRSHELLPLVSLPAWVTARREPGATAAWVSCLANSALSRKRRRGGAEASAPSRLSLILARTLHCHHL